MGKLSPSSKKKCLVVHDRITKKWLNITFIQILKVCVFLEPMTLKQDPSKRYQHVVRYTNERLLSWAIPYLKVRVDLSSPLPRSSTRSLGQPEVDLSRSGAYT